MIKVYIQHLPVPGTFSLEIVKIVIEPSLLGEIPILMSMDGAVKFHQWEDGGVAGVHRKLRPAGFHHDQEEQWNKGTEG